MKFDQLIERNMKNIFLEKSYSKCGGETSPRPFSEKLIFWINILTFYRVCFYGYQNYLKRSCRPLTFTSFLAFLKTKRSGTSLPASFSV